jgi:two-component system sensor histidine kinase PilS (NtrC family)
MSGSIQLLRSGIELDGEQEALMEIALTESARLNRIIEEFLFYAKPAPLLPVPVDLGSLADQTVALFRNSSELKDTHEIVVTKSEGDLLVAADLSQLRQVLWNLLRNAAQAMPAGGRLELKVGPGDTEGVLVEVQDSGEGFPEESVESFWTPFHRSHTQGSGLGLAIVYRIVREHGGRVTLANRKPNGASVRVWLPRAGPAAAEVATPPPAIQEVP